MTRTANRPATRSFRPDDLYRLRVATDPRISPDGAVVAFNLQTVAPGKDGYRNAIWAVDVAGGAPRRLTLGARHDTHARFSPDGRTLAFLSDRRLHVEEEPAAGDAKDREDAQQIHLLPLDGGEAARLTDLPRGVRDFEWSPDGNRIVYSTNLRRDHDLEPRSHLVAIDVASGGRTRLTGEPALLFAPTWLPDGRTVAAIGGYLP